MKPIIFFNKEIVINPVLFDFGFASIYWYAAIIVSAFGISFFLITRRVKKNINSYDIKLDDIYDLAIGLLLVGIMSARLYYVLFNWERYSKNPIEIFKIWNGGLAIYGGIIGVMIFAIILSKIKKIKFYDLADLVIPYLSLCQSLGRWGNFINQEAYGYECTMPWKMGIFNEQLGNYIYVHPTFLYESIFDFILFLILILTTKNRKFSGQVFCSYMIGYGMIRGVVEGFRTDSLMLGSFRISQVLSIVFVLIFGILYFYKRKCRTKDV